MNDPMVAVAGERFASRQEERGFGRIAPCAIQVSPVVTPVAGVFGGSDVIRRMAALFPPKREAQTRVRVRWVDVAEDE
jgi:hypothetical protein